MGPNPGRGGLERGTVLALAADRVFACRGDQRLARDAVDPLPVPHLDGDVMGLDTSSAEGMAGHRHLGRTVLVEVGHAADIGVEVHIQVQTRTRGLLIDLPARLEGFLRFASAIQGGLEHDLVHFLLTFRVAGLAIDTAQDQQPFAVPVAVVHTLERCLHAQHLQLLHGDRRQHFEGLRLASCQEQTADREAQDNAKRLGRHGMQNPRRHGRKRRNG